MNRIFTYLLFVLALLAGAFWLGQRSVRPSIEAVETVRVDTIYRDRPVPVASTLRPVTISVPRVLFAGDNVNDPRKSFTDDAANDKESATGVIPNATGVYDNQSANIAASTNHDANYDANYDATADSVAVEIAIETRTYRDSLLTAQISGPVVGDYRPTLDWYEAYGYSRTTTNTVTKRSRFAVTAGAGVAWTPEGLRPTVGVQVGVVLWGW